MQLSQFEDLVQAGAVGFVVVFGSPAEGWQVQILNDRYGSIISGSERLELQRGGARVFGSLDSAIRVVQAAGWSGSVMVDAVGGAGALK